MTDVQLDSTYRSASLARMANEEFDLIVIGGGITGVGAALDAATRGLSVALVEARDFAAGTSSRSGKLIHGGLRYLEMLDFALVREALRERKLLLTSLAPHLVKPVPFLFPLKRRVWDRLYVGAGLALYDALGGGRAVPRARHLTRSRALKLAPSLRPDALIGAVQFYDAQEDDARFAVYVARTAAQNGAVLATYTSAIGLRFTGDRVSGVRVRDHESGAEIDVKGRHVVSAAGVWNDDIHGWAAGRAPARVRPSKGVHIVVPRSCIDADSGLFIRTEKSVLFIVPWGRHWLIGDTDTDWPYDKVEPAASSADIEYLLAQANAVLRTPLSRKDIEGVFVGLRPLAIAGGGVATEKVSREHVVYSAAPGLSMIAGGKYTTYRVMAEDLVDVAARQLGRDVPASRTARVPILGAAGYEARRNRKHQLAEEATLTVEQVERLLDRYGSCVDDLVAILKQRPDLGMPIPNVQDYLDVEVAYACTHEGALHLEDVLARRTRITVQTRDRGVRAAPHVAALMARELARGDQWVSREVENYTRRVNAELAAEQQPDDESANAARLRGLALYSFYPSPDGPGQGSINGRPAQVPST